MRRRDVKLPFTSLSLVITLIQSLSPLRLGVFQRTAEIAILLAAVAMVGEVVALDYIPQSFTYVANKLHGEANQKNSTNFAIQTAAKSTIPAVAIVLQATAQETDSRVCILAQLETAEGQAREVRSGFHLCAIGNHKIRGGVSY